MRDPLKVLVVEDDAVTRQILLRILTDRGYQVSAFGTAEEAMRACEERTYPLLFLDLVLPGADGFAFCRWFRGLPGGDRSLVLVGTASEHPDDLRRILNAGADDYIRKPYRRDLLDIRLTIAEERIKQLEAKRLLEESLSQERERLRYLAVHDPLTGVRNRATLAETMDRVIDEARQGVPGALIYIDLDHFKSVNDSLGHAAGDAVLTTDEFCILLQALKLSEVKLIAQGIRVNIEDALRSSDGNPCAVAVSIGITAIDGKVSGDRVMGLADDAVYRAKAAGGDRIEC